MLTPEPTEVGAPNRPEPDDDIEDELDRYFDANPLPPDEDEDPALAAAYFRWLKRRHP